MLGLVIYLLMMATSFMGYVLPWGQMSYWGAQVITGFFGLSGGRRADPGVAAGRLCARPGGADPLLLAPLPAVRDRRRGDPAHLGAAHSGIVEPDRRRGEDEKDTLPFHPFYTAKDGWFAGLFLTIYAAVVFFAPNALGHPDNYIPANPLATPAHIVPEWYFWPFYAILRAFTVDFILPAKLWGVLAMFASILLFFLPWLDKSPVRSAAYRPMFKRINWLLWADVLLLGLCGMKPAKQPCVALSQIGSAYYFAHFLIILPLVSKFERPLPLPNSISKACCTARRRKLHRSASSRRPLNKGNRGPWSASLDFSSGWVSPAFC